MPQVRAVWIAARLTGCALSPRSRSARKPVAPADQGGRVRLVEVVDQLVGVPREAVERVHVRPLGRRQQQGGQVVGPAVRRVEPPALLVRRAQRRIGDPRRVQLPPAHGCTPGRRPDPETQTVPPRRQCRRQSPHESTAAPVVCRGQRRLCPQDAWAVHRSRSLGRGQVALPHRRRMDPVTALDRRLGASWWRALIAGGCDRRATCAARSAGDRCSRWAVARTRCRTRRRTPSWLPRLEGAV